MIPVDPTPPPGKICVILTGALGDFILALPALSALRSIFPSSRIDLAGNPLWLPLAGECTAVDRTLSVDDISLHEGFMETVPENNRLSRVLAGYDIILSWFGDREGVWEKNLERLVPGRSRVFPFHRNRSFPGHVSDYYLNTLREAGFGPPGKTGDPPWHLSRLWKPPPVPGGRDASTTFAGGHGLCIHPGSGSNRKNWPSDRFLEVAEAAHERWKVPVRIVLGPAETDQQSFWREQGRSRFDLQIDPPLKEVFRSLPHAALYLGNDSGITHLAASLGVPTLALFGPTDPNLWAPRGPRVKVLRSGGEEEGAKHDPPRETLHGLPGMKPDEVLETLATLR